MLRFIARCWRGELKTPIFARPLSVLMLIALLWMFFLFLIVPQFVSGLAPTPINEAPIVVSPPALPKFGVHSADPLQPEVVAVGQDVAWHRWMLPWWQVEQVPSVYDWSPIDAVVQADLAQGLRPAVVLFGTPNAFSTAVFPSEANLVSDSANGPREDLGLLQTAVPTGLHLPIFADGSDVAGPGKQLNANNVWARFVFTAVSRYRPNGELARQGGWSAHVGITHWEIWTQPDAAAFWSGTAEDYARLLQVAFVAARQADPNANIIFGGLASASNTPNFYDAVLQIYDLDAAAVGHRYYHHATATDGFQQAAFAETAVRNVRHAQRQRSLVKSIWLGAMPTWPNWQAAQEASLCRGNNLLQPTSEEQANWLIQRALFAMYVEADVIFFAPLDGQCGDQVDVAELAVRTMGNLMAHFSGSQPIGRLASDGWEQLVFYHSGRHERLVGVWATGAAGQTAVVPAVSASGTGWLVSMDGSARVITAVNGNFIISLPGATYRGELLADEPALIGGEPLLLVESLATP